MAAPPLMTLRGASISFGGKPLFAELDLQLGRGDRACLVGRNGTGKSTLLKILAGLIELDAGELFRQPGVKASYLPQDPAFDPDVTVAAHVAADGEPAHRVDAMLAQVELDGARRLGTLSGGEGRRAAIARALVGEPEILLFDEPTNHLDLAAIDWLERILTGFGGALLMVSHDRAFLNRVTTRTFWLDRGRLRRSEQGFASFDDWSEAVLEAELKEAERLDSKLRDETHWLLRGVTARRRRNQGRLRKLEVMRATRAALLGGRGGRGKMAVEDGEIKSRLVIEAKDIAKSFTDPESGAERVIVRGFSTRVLRGDRIGLVGANGAGKTTLLRMLTGDLEPDRGSVKLAKNLTQAYFDQHRAVLNREKSLWETLIPAGGDQVMVHGQPRHVRSYLKDFLFDPRQAESPVGSLSGGERNRLLLAKIMAMPSELLVLDEPTNDLDMDTLDLLQEMLAEYPGTLLLVSHDRDFLDKTVSSTIVMEGDGSAIEYAGGYTDYLAQRRLRDSPRAEPSSPPKAAPRETRRPAPRQRLGYKDQRDLDLLPERVTALEAEIRDLEATLGDPALFQRDRAAFDRATARIEAARAELDAAETRWLELEERRDALAQSNG